MPQIFAGGKISHILCKCENCGSKMRAPSRYNGKVVNCLKCGELVLVGSRTSSKAHSQTPRLDKPIEKQQPNIEDKPLEELIEKTATENSISNNPKSPNKQSSLRWLVVIGVMLIVALTVLIWTRFDALPYEEAVKRQRTIDNEEKERQKVRHTELARRQQDEENAKLKRQRDDARKLELIKTIAHSLARIEDSRLRNRDHLDELLHEMKVKTQQAEDAMNGQSRATHTRFPYVTQEAKLYERYLTLSTNEYSNADVGTLEDIAKMWTADETFLCK